MAKRSRSEAEKEADKHRTGRPRKPVAEKQSEKVMVYLTSAERTRLGELATKEGLSLASLIMQPWREQEK